MHSLRALSIFYEFPTKLFVLPKSGGLRTRQKMRMLEENDRKDDLFYGPTGFL